MNCNVCQTPNQDNAASCVGCGRPLLADDQPEVDPLIGQDIKKTFRVVRLLGEGGMGRVYEGVQQMGNVTRKVAVKTLHPYLSQDPQIVARFNRECGTVAELEHPNTIQFFDFGFTEQKQLFIAMEFLDGKSVSAVIEHEGAMEPRRVDKILRQVCGSLTEAHKKGIIHRDLKPENVQLTTRAGEEDFVKVLDFGIAARREGTDRKKEEKLTQQGTVLGTPPYMSPEQFTGKELDARSDIYSLGVMAYEMLTGKLPFEAETPWEWATKHLSERPYPFEVTAPHAEQIPESMKRAIMRALAKNRDDRQPTIMAFYDDLSAAAGPAAVAGTAAMLAVPQPGAAYPGPAMAPMQGAPLAQPPVYGAPPMAPPQPYAQASGGGGGKGLFIAIGGFVALGAIVGVVFLARALTKRSSGEEDGTLGATLGSATGVTELLPVEAGAAPDSPDAGTKTVPTKTATTASSTPPDTKGPAGEEACRQSANMARNGQIEAAVGLYHACEKGGSSMSVAKAAIAQYAGPAATKAGFNHDCAKAKRIASAAASIGAAGTSQNEASKCK